MARLRAMVGGCGVQRRDDRAVPEPARARDPCTARARRSRRHRPDGAEQRTEPRSEVRGGGHAGRGRTHAARLQVTAHCVPWSALQPDVGSATMASFPQIVRIDVRSGRREVMAHDRGCSTSRPRCSSCHRSTGGQRSSWPRIRSTGSPRSTPRSPPGHGIRRAPAHKSSVLRPWRSGTHLVTRRPSRAWSLAAEPDHCQFEAKCATRRFVADRAVGWSIVLLAKNELDNCSLLGVTQTITGVTPNWPLKVARKHY